MQLFISAKTDTIKEPDKFSWWGSLRKLAYTRTAIGFTVGEAMLWLGFVVMWPVLLGSIYFLGGIFQSGRAMPVEQFIATSLVVAIIKAIVILPVWWLFFMRLRNVALWKRIALHPITGCLYSLACIYLIYQSKKHFLISIGPTNAIVVQKDKAQAIQEVYPKSAILMDFYNLLTAYVMNFVLFHAYNFWLSSQRQKKREQEIRELAFQSEINALKTQIEPHFLFNTLNSISASVPPTLEKTRVLIAQLADTFRYALQVSERRVVPLSDELEFMKTWLALEQHRFGKRLTIHYKIDPETLQLMVPPMLLQPLVENAINHGIAQRLEGGAVTIECRMQEDDTVLIAVRDTGVGYAGDFTQMMNKGVGLSNIAKRLQLLYNQQLQIDRLPQGLSFSFYIPTKQVHETERIDN